MKHLTLRRFNDALTLVVVLLCLYVILAPFLPNVLFWWEGSVTKNKPPLVAALENPQASENIPDKNTLVIPSMRLEQEIHEGSTQAALNKGVWRNPQTSSPDLGENTVLIGHRFTYGGPAVFYHLDKVKVGELVVVYWNQKRYDYQVETILEVPPTAVEVEQKEVGEDRLTIYTCTPLVTAHNRLVIQARLVTSEGKSS